MAENGEITVLIADDHEVVREGLRLALLRSPHIRVVGRGRRRRDGRLAHRAPPTRRRDHGSADAADGRHRGDGGDPHARPRGPRARVHRVQRASAALQRGLESGARGYILKEAPHETLLKAIEKVAAGETFVDPALIPSLASGRDGQEILTGREREILQLLADGMSNADVAQRLFISQETVKSHVRHILAKLEAETRTQAVAIALREAMID